MTTIANLAPKLAHPVGADPTTSRLTGGRSAVELRVNLGWEGRIRTFSALRRWIQNPLGLPIFLLPKTRLAEGRLITATFTCADASVRQTV